jgi:hypothetical protein
VFLRVFIGMEFALKFLVIANIIQVINSIMN